MIKCAACGQDNREGARFCKWCGALLTSVEPSPVVAPQVMVEGPARTPEAELPRAQDALPPAQSQVPVEQLPKASATSVEPRAIGEATAALEPPPQKNEERVEQRLVGAQQAAQGEVQGPMAEVTPPGEPATLAVPVLTVPVILAERCELTEVVEQTNVMVVYRGFDRSRCWQCGAPRMDRTDVYCGDCGAEIGRGAPCRVQAGDVPPDALPENVLTQDGMTFWIQLEPMQAPAPVSVVPAKGLRLCVGYASDPGAVREVDEDSLLVVTGLGMMEGAARPSLGLFAVADGMGGHDNGQLASRRVIQVLAEWLLPRLITPTLGGETILPETFEEQVREAVREANRRLTSEAHAAHSDMGSTLTLALVRDGTAIIANVGDSRTYLWRNAILEQVTEDHSVVARLIAGGMLDRDEIYTHTRRNEIYRVMGDKPEIEVDVFTRELQPGNRLVLCCDGVWDMIRDEGIADVLLALDDPQAACDEMVKQANMAGGEDNISVIVVDMRG